MRTALLAVLFAIGSAFSSAQAQSNDSADTPLGSRISRELPAQPSDDPGLTDEDRGLRATFEYGECLRQVEEKNLRPLLSLKPMALSRRQQRALNQPRCLMAGELRIPGEIIRGAVFRAFYLADYGARQIVFGAPVDYFQFVDRRFAVEVNSALMLDFASCVVRADQTNARAMIAGNPGEPAFEKALQALIPQLGPCLPEGLQVEFSKSILSAKFAEALYWEAQSSQQADMAGSE